MPIVDFIAPEVFIPRNCLSSDLFTLKCVYIIYAGGVEQYGDISLFIHPNQLGISTWFNPP